MKTINKTVVVNGISTKVKFGTERLTNNSFTERFQLGTVANDYAFEIDGQTHIVKCITKATNGGWQGYRMSNSFEFDGRNFGDSEKKVIEYILSK